VQEAGTCIQRIQKALTEMNQQLANVICDVSGMTGLRFLHAIVEGERDPQRLSALRDWRIKATAENVAKSLQGNWRDELIFVLEENLYQQKIGRCDERIEQYLQSMSAKVKNDKMREAARLRSWVCSSAVRAIAATRRPVRMHGISHQNHYLTKSVAK
jgi:hypothetical protein